MRDAALKQAIRGLEAQAERVSGPHRDVQESVTQVPPTPAAEGVIVEEVPAEAVPVGAPDAAAIEEERVANAAHEQAASVSEKLSSDAFGTLEPVAAEEVTAELDEETSDVVESEVLEPEAAAAYAADESRLSFEQTSEPAVAEAHSDVVPEAEFYVPQHALRAFEEVPAKAQEAMDEFTLAVRGDAVSMAAEPKANDGVATPDRVASAPLEASEEEELAPVGRLVEEDDRVVEVPSHTQSKIRIAFADQELSPKTTWFSKLFRGDPPASFRIVPAEEDDGPALQASRGLRREPPVLARPSRITSALVERPASATDAELDHLLSRISVRREETSQDRADAEMKELGSLSESLSPEEPELRATPSVETADVAALEEAQYVDSTPEPVSGELRSALRVEDRPSGLSRRWALLSRYEEPAEGRTAAVPELAYRPAGDATQPDKEV